MTVLQPGRYVCVRTGGALAAVIRKATGSEYDHAFLVAGNGGIIESRLDGGVHAGRLSDYAGCPAVANTGEVMTVAQRGMVVASASVLIGSPYNYPDLVSLGFAELGWHWRFLIALCGGDRAFICSQLVAASGHAAGLDWQCGDTSQDEVTPAQLARRPGMASVTIRR